MQYKFIKYARTRTLPNHENERIEVSVEVHKGEDPEKVFEDAKDFVETRLGLRKRKDARPVEERAKDWAAMPAKGATLGDALAAKGQSL